MFSSVQLNYTCVEFQTFISKLGVTMTIVYVLCEQPSYMFKWLYASINFTSYWAVRKSFINSYILNSHSGNCTFFDHFYIFLCVKMAKLVLPLLRTRKTELRMFNTLYITWYIKKLCSYKNICVLLLNVLSIGRTLTLASGET